MDKEIKSLNKKTAELNTKIKNLEDEKKKLNKQKSKNYELMCILLKNFIEKKLIPPKIHMIINLYPNKYSKLLEQNKILKKKIDDLTEELISYKSEKKGDNNLIANNNINLNEEEKDNRMQIYNKKDGNKGYIMDSSQGLGKVIDIGTTTQQIGNTIITTKTTQISYKRRRLDNNQQ